MVLEHPGLSAFSFLQAKSAMPQTITSKVFFIVSVFLIQYPRCYRDGWVNWRKFFFQDNPTFAPGTEVLTRKEYIYSNKKRDAEHHNANFCSLLGGLQYLIIKINYTRNL